MKPVLDERGRRRWAATEAIRLGRGGITQVSKATGISRPTIYAGIREIENSTPLEEGRVRQPGGGRKSLSVKMPGLVEELDSLVEPTSKGDPMSSVRWICKSTRTIADELDKRGMHISHVAISQLLHKLGYSLQGNRKAEEGHQHPDRNAQFMFINKTVGKELSCGNPVISVDTKKKELVGNYQNPGRRWRKKKSAPRVNGHDFPGPEVPRAYPYGIYDLGRNEGLVVVGTDHDTAAFAVNSIRKWWMSKGLKCYPHAKHITITADSGGSNGSRLRMWKWELHNMANAIGLPISVCHFPPGTSKWNKVEHRLFSFISQTWKSIPLKTYEVIVSLIASTTTRTGLKVECRLDKRTYKIGREVSDEQMAEINIKRNEFHGEWNYTIFPKM